uniref:Uncharacterized protein n=1 Tax=Timema genevievae TaxID=629358 RepID=A0A7R9K0C8_TIMGE|nr:unnamed protein product [Timema genevievae]
MPSPSAPFGFCDHGLGL